MSLRTIVAHNFDSSIALNISTQSYSIGNNVLFATQFGRTAHLVGMLGKEEINIF